MEPYIFAFIATILLLPILYFLPMGIHFKGKLMLAGVAFILSIGMLLLHKVATWWQIGLILIPIVYLISLQLTRWMESLAVSTGVEKDPPPVKEEAPLKTKEILVEDKELNDIPLEAEDEEIYQVVETQKQIAATTTIEEDTSSNLAVLDVEKEENDGASLEGDYSEVDSAEGSAVLEEVSEDVHQEFIAEEKVKPKPVKTKLQQQMFHMMIEGIRIQEKKLTPSSYESYVKEHLHPDLPDQDYYTFAQLLIQHYIKHSNYKELKILIESIQTRMNSYLMIREELSYIYAKYCQDV